MNRLVRERSPYLLQHAHNPVDWYPWGEEAFARARTEDKPIFLSVGYATCHWCHVMERESFESESVASLLNDAFVSIKVDREERPDVDRVYMGFVQATTGSGGWPMSVWLTPELKPFFGGTYFPPDTRWNRPGFVDVLKEVARSWRVNRREISRSADVLTQRLREIARAAGASSVPGVPALVDTVRQFREVFDAENGGFGAPPKFPRPSELLFLFREHARTGDVEAREMALRTLRAMALGGMRDHVGGGFHRYAVDAEWRVPHFEKMLYDQAQIALALLEAAQLTGDPFFAEVADDTLQYVRREMTEVCGGFCSAEDADSISPEQADRPGTHKSEGAFYVWSADEIDAALGDDASVFKQRFGIEAAGNAPFDPQQEFVGKNLLYVARSVDDAARETGRATGSIVPTLDRARRRLLEQRMHRPRPLLDDKVLTAWNGLMIAAFARGARVLEAGGGERSSAGKAHLLAARRAAAFIREKMWDGPSGRLLHRYRDGDADIEAYAEDFACLVWGLLELFQADPDPAWLDWAVALQRRQDELFWDEAEGGWFSTTGRDASVLFRLKGEYDGAEPSANSVSVMNLILLSHLSPDPVWMPRVEATLRHFGGRLDRTGRAMPMMAAALSTSLAGVQHVVLVGDDRRALERVVARRYLPFALVLSLDGDQQRALAASLPLVESMQPIGGRATAYVCRRFVCAPPATSAEELERLLD
jgi:uncharacterized protein YyaL (SSP411 family)